MRILRQREVGLLDSLYMDSLAVQRKLKIEADAPTLMKDAISNPDKNSKSTKAARGRMPAGSSRCRSSSAGRACCRRRSPAS
jgi:hypothetical protein